MLVQKENGGIFLLLLYQEESWVEGVGGAQRPPPLQEGWLSTTAALQSLDKWPFWNYHVIPMSAHLGAVSYLQSHAGKSLKALYKDIKMMTH